jgi:transcriptional regulator of heat shock response
MLPRSRIGVCDRCDNLFWAPPRRKLNKRFCRRKCAQRQTASEAQAKRLAEERGEKNKRIRQAIKEFRKEKHSKADWKAFVTGHANVTRSYLTRAINRRLRGEADGLKVTKAQIQYLESRWRSDHANL